MSNNNPVMFDGKSAERTAAAVKWVERQPNSPAESPSTPVEKAFWAKITSAFDSTTGYDFTMQKPNAVGGWANHDFSSDHLFDPNGDTAIPTGAIRLVIPRGATSAGLPLFHVVGAGGSGSPPTTLRAKLTGNLAGTGAYSGLEVLPPAAGDISGSSNVSESLLGTTTGGRTLIVFNYAEVGGATGSHILEVGIGARIYTASIVQVNSDGKVVCTIFDALPNGTAKGQVLQMQTSSRFAFGQPTFGT